MRGATTSGRLREAFIERARTCGERGAVLVETALVFLVVVMMAFGIIEYSLMLRQLDDMADGVRAGTRAASAASDNSSADWDIIQAMKDSNTGLAGDITDIVIFKANAQGEPTANCANFTTQSGQCNVYRSADFGQNKSYIDSRAANQGGWRPVDRSPQVDYIGVRARTQYTWVTNFFASTPKPLTDSAVALIEPAGVVPTGPSTGLGSGWTSGTNDPPPRGSQVPTAPCPSCGGGSGGGGPVNG